MESKISDLGDSEISWKGDREGSWKCDSENILSYTELLVFHNNCFNTHEQ